ncbi:MULTISPECIES: SMI1/KNR4 family protein [Listeria]|uniref:SMI1/KNR4 family protein n=1 Tax=Listeria TaxID=1637 RepID=UPI000B593A20|nr:MULTISPECIES: SMI1/KNR4 family protein [Listeria]
MDLAKQLCKVLYYLDKGKELEAIKTLDNIIPTAKNEGNQEVFVRATIVLADVSYKRGERFSEMANNLTEVLQLERGDFDDSLNVELEKANELQQIFKKYFEEEGKFFKGLDLKTFFNTSYGDEYQDAYPTDEIIQEIEAELGFKLPASYIYLMRHAQNGGIPCKDSFPTNEATSWSEDSIVITGIMGIGKQAASSLCGEFSTEFWESIWGYPKIGVSICDCPSAGHDMVFLDYRACGSEGEPTVVHVDQEADYKITFLAKNFEAFITGLYSEVY